MSTTKYSFSDLTGAAIPLSALKTQHSCGVGEFLDLIPFIDFCKKCDLSLIQLLPVNDTGTESSPYSALSAFALHPLYIRLQALSEAASFKKEIASLAKKHAHAERFNYKEVRRDKIDLLIRIFEANSDVIMADKSLDAWIKAHPWIVPYAVFIEKKRVHHEASWKSWEDETPATEESIRAEWEKAEKRKNHYFAAWVQMRLDEQFREAAEYARANGIIIKGDIPIMMNEDSADTWAHGEFFKNELRAGSPPDNYNPVGQNWGFPIYNWENLQKDNYSWWKERLKSAATYYGAYRIDHILGFFRIWAIPEGETTAALGYTEPFEPITLKELKTLGFDDERIRWLSKPHVQTREIEAVNGNDYLSTHGHLHKLMDKIEDEELWLFKSNITRDSDIYAADIPGAVKQKLAECWRNRALIEVAKNKFTPLWCYRDSTAWKSLNDEERESLQELFDKKHAKMEKLWEKQAKTLLAELTGAVDMIPCGEDLGALPDCVPRVMQALNILSLRILRWSRHWSEDGQPYVDPKEYPRFSVAANSVHDSSTIREWWLNEHAGEDFIRDFGECDGVSADEFTPATARFVLGTIATATSAFCIHPFQDLLHLVSTYYDANPTNERINVPGSVTDFNWTYRIPKNVETLAKDTALIAEIKKLVALHTGTKAKTAKKSR